MSPWHRRPRRGPKRPAGQTRERVLAWVRERLRAGFPPTVREVQAEFGFRAVESAREHLENLVAEGRLVKEEGCARGYRLPSRDAPPNAFVPLLGSVPAGPLEEAVEERLGLVPVALGRGARRARIDRVFALRVHGDSMRDAGILDGDLILVRAQPDARDGDIVVARVDGEATVKRLRLRRGRIELHPENPAYAPIVLEPGSAAAIVGPGRDAAIVGKVIEVRRELESV